MTSSTAASTHLKECLRQEVQKNGKPFSWFKTIHRAIKCNERRFYFWLRIWGYLYQTNKFGMAQFAKKKMYFFNRKYSSDINPGAKIGPGLKLSHYPGVIIRGGAIIGDNALIRQGVTIGIKRENEAGCIRIGDNVEIGANCCIIGNLIIGNNVTIGAMPLVNKNIADNVTVFSEKTMTTYQK